MPDWTQYLSTALKRDSKAVMVTVIAAGGSVPREVGATMIVSAGGNTGSIGGGNLELTCIREAFEMLSHGKLRKCKQLSLGPGLGQCCGGRVELLFDCVASEPDWLGELTDGHHAVSDRWLCRSLDTNNTLVLTADEQAQHSRSGNIDPSGNSSMLVAHTKTDRWFYQSLSIKVPAVWIYGAGHVGQAVASQLSLLDCDITVLDHREEWQCLQPELEIDRILTDAPEDDAVSAPVDAAHVVMTHSHALDFEICLAVLKRARFGWLGLIGSDTKRQTFVNRLGQRGISEAVISRMRCPIGKLHLESSHPSVIALSLAAELALHWELKESPLES